MNLEYGKIVDEFKVHDDIPVTSFNPEKASSGPDGLRDPANGVFRNSTN
jgi:hypothetical protein